MSQSLVTTEHKNNNLYGALHSEHTDMLMTIRISGQLFGIPVLMIQDVLRDMSITPIPLAASVIAGSMNLRGRTVTVIDMCKRLEIDANPDRKIINVVVEYNKELVSLQVDEVGDVLSLPANTFEKSPPNMDGNWRDIALGVYRLDDELLVVIDIDGLLDLRNYSMIKKQEKPQED